MKVFLLLTVLLFATGSTEKDKKAFRVTCPSVTIIVMPATGTNLERAQKIAECVSPEERVCAIDVIGVRAESR